jgi:outer membrane immunogenic protein
LIHAHYVQLEVGIKHSLTTAFSAVAHSGGNGENAMKKLLLAIVGSVALGVAAPALAADMPVKAAPPPPVAPIYNWTGFYIGAHVGGAWSDTDWFYPCSATNLLILSPCNLAQGGHSGSSWLAGGQVGFNYQVGRFVWGIEADFSATDIKGSNLDAAFPLQEFLHSRTDFIGTVAPRVGVAWDRVLLYAKGGVAWAHDDYWLTLTPNQLLAGQTFAAGDATRWGWIVGVGIEYAFAQNWSVKAEYNYMDFGTERIFVKSTGIEPTQPNFEEDIGRKIQVVKIGLNYKFDWSGPLVAKY